MNAVLGAIKRLVKKARSIAQSTWLSYPKKVQCNICGWEGRHFASDAWHKHINCPRCGSGIRQRLFIGALQHTEQFSFDRIINGKTILHFAPEPVIHTIIRNKAGKYTTTDFLRSDCDIRLDMSNMPEIDDASCDRVIAFDVLEHVPDHLKALEEIHRILGKDGQGIFTVPQKDGLASTYEDSSIVSPEGRTRHFGQWDHLRIFGDDFAELVNSKGFDVTVVDQAMFTDAQVRKHVLFPPELSQHPLATNYRKVFFCRKRV